MKSTIEDIAKQFNITKKLAKAVVHSVVHSFAVTLVTEGELKLAEIGTIRVETKQERNGSNPRTGLPIVIKEHKVLKLIPTAAIKNAIQ